VRGGVPRVRLSLFVRIGGRTLPHGEERTPTGEVGKMRRTIFLLLAAAILGACSSEPPSASEALKEIGAECTPGVFEAGGTTMVFPTQRECSWRGDRLMFFPFDTAAAWAEEMQAGVDICTSPDPDYAKIAGEIEAATDGRSFYV
jgi:hypothetical protein